MKNPLLPMFCQ